MKFTLYALAGILSLTPAGRAQTTAFTYQGQLSNSNGLATGSYDFRFQIYSTAGVVAGPLTNAPVGVTNGLFTVTLDFGSGVFDGTTRTLEIGVRNFGNTNAYAVLAPRQPLTSVPYAIQAINASNAVVLTGPLPATNLVGTIPNSLLSANVAVLTNNVTFSGSVTATTFNGSFVGNGSGLTSVPGTSLTGTIPDARLSTNVALQSSPNLNFAGTVSATNFTGAGHGLTNVPGAFFWVVVAGTNTQAQPNVGYICTNDVGPVTIALPPSASLSVGDTFRVAGVGGAGWVIAQTNNQSILAGNLSSSIAQSWRTSGPVAFWTAVASSANGTKLVATINSGQIYTSANSGSTWTARATALFWSSVASSADGTKLAATVGNTANQTGLIWTSTDSGATWGTQSSSSGTRQWVSIAASADGTTLVAANYTGGATPGVYTSINSGSSWVLRKSISFCSAVASSADGTKMVAAINGGQIWTSTDSGATWTARDSSRSWIAVASSSDGSRLMAVVNSGQLYISADSGVTWTPSTPNISTTWTSVASSADGSRLAGVSGTTGNIYNSTDSGATWVQQNSAPTTAWTGIASSADGSQLVAVASPGSGSNIYISSLAGTTTGTTGYLVGPQHSAIELIYTGNNLFLPLSHEGTIRAY